MLGVLVLIVGAYLVDSAVVNRKPIQTLTTIITHPNQAQTALKGSHGTGFAPAVIVTQTSPSDTQGSTGITTDTLPAGASSTGAAAVAWAQTQIGKPYKWGATGPNAYDCSGLVQAAYKTVGVSLPRTTAGMILKGSRVAKADLQVGDLVFPDAGHVQLYAGGGTVVEAPRTGLKVRQVAMWGFLTARRVT